MTNKEIQNREIPEGFSIKAILLKTMYVTVGILAVVMLLAYFFRKPLTQFSELIVQKVGLVGIFIGVTLADAFTFPIPPDSYLLLSVTSKQSSVMIIATICAASIFAGNIAYLMGPFLQKIPYIQNKLDKFRPQGEYLFERWGMWAVIIAALTPIPFSIICWSAGIYKMRYSSFFVGTLFRIPRFIGYYYLLLLGWL